MPSCQQGITIQILLSIYIYMNLGQPCPYNTETFVNGITNGAEYGIQLSVECKTTITYVETNLLLSKAATSFL